MVTAAVAKMNTATSRPMYASVLLAAVAIVIGIASLSRGSG